MWYKCPKCKRSISLKWVIFCNRVDGKDYVCSCGSLFYWNKWGKMIDFLSLFFAVFLALEISYHVEFIADLQSKDSLGKILGVIICYVLVLLIQILLKIIAPKQFSLAQSRN